MKVSKKLILALGCCGVMSSALAGCSLGKCKHEETTITGQVAASCVAPGYTGDTVCIKCEEITLAGQTIANLPHQTELVGAKEATCKDDGYTGDDTCTVCQTVVTPGETIAALGHTGEEINKKEPTCQEAGYSGDMKCTVCEEIYQKGVVMDSVDHDWQEVEVQKEATCKQEGKHTVECRFCQTKQDEVVPKLEHTIVTDPSVEATCTTAGKTEGKRCATCKTVIEQQKTIAALGHDVVVTTQGTEPTCTKDGKASVSRCQRCNEQLTNGETLKASGHKEVKTNAVAATCTAPGKTEGSSCSVCKTVIKESTSVAASGHKNVANEEVAATCEKEGKTGGTHCSVCNTVTAESRVVPALGHKTVVQNLKAATCTEKGYTGDDYCENCKTIIKKGTDVDMLEHKLQDVGNSIEATCVEEGRTSDKICLVCETVVEPGVVIEKIAHNYEVKTGSGVAPTCTTYGYEDSSVCSICKDEQKGDRIAKIPHNRVEDESTIVEATCQIAGKKADIICSECNKTLKTGRETKKVACVGVTADDAKASTCTEQGNEPSTICKWCETVLKEGAKLPLAPHTEIERNGVESTCAKEGQTPELFCTTCNQVTKASEKIEKQPHTPVKTKEDIAATCTSTGLIAGTKCDVCKVPLTEDEVTEVLDHYYTNKDKYIDIQLNKETYETAVVTMQCDGCFETKNFDGVVSSKVVSKQPTCTEAGAMTCVVTIEVAEGVSFDYDVVSPMDILDHEEAVTPGKAPTCTQDGYTESAVCANCNAPLVEKVIIPARHTDYQLVSFAFDTEYNTDGCDVTLQCTCGDCGESFTARAKKVEEISRKEATCLEDGLIVTKVRVDTDEYSDIYMTLEEVQTAKKHRVTVFPQYNVAEGETPAFDLKTGEVYCELTCADCEETFKYIYDGSAELTTAPSCEKQGEITIKWEMDAESIRIDGPTFVGQSYKNVAATGHAYDIEESPDICVNCNTYKSLGYDENDMMLWFESEEIFQGSITKLTIQKDIPEEGTYTKSWIVDRDNEGYLMAYLTNETELIISTMGAAKLYLNTNGVFLRNFISLAEIEGFELVDISNCESLNNTFANCQALTSLDISHWVTEKETIILNGTFNNCNNLTTILATQDLANKVVAPEIAEGEDEIPAFTGCTKLVGTQTGGEEDVVTAYDSAKVGAEAAKLYFTYEIVTD